MEWPLQLIAKLYSNFNNFFYCISKKYHCWNSHYIQLLHNAQPYQIVNIALAIVFIHDTYLVSTIFPLMTSFAEIWKYAPLRFRSVDSGDEKSSAISTYSPGNMHIQTHIRLCTCCTSVHAYCTYCKYSTYVHT